MNAPHYTTLTFEDKNGIAVVTFNRPDQLNAMNRRMMEEIIDAVNRIHLSDTVRVGVLTGAGRAFMAGADIKEYARQTREEFISFQTLGRQLYAALEGNEKPIIAAINGHAFGGGLEIALACDMIVAAEGAKMGLPEILLNLIPGGGGTQRLPRKLGPTLAAELVLSGRTATAEELHARGLINHLYPRERFHEATLAFAATFADKSPEALQILKQLVQLAHGPTNPAHQAIENEALARFYQSKPGQAKIREFLDKSEARAREKAVK